jgi:ADP-ribose pyrophosphatase
MSVARISRRIETEVSPWVRLVTKQVEETPGSSQTYHCLALADYVAVVARLPDGRLPIVKQFRPAVERDTWELPAGLLEPTENARAAATRELLEETGYMSRSVIELGTLLPDTGRLENRIHLFAIEAAEPQADFVPEPGVSVALVSPAELRAMILDGQFNHQLHVGALALAELKGFHTGVFDESKAR